MIAEKFDPDYIECIIRSAAELWDNVDRDAADEYLSEKQKHALSAASAALQAEFDDTLDALPERSVITPTEGSS